MQPVEKISCEQFLHFVDNYPPISSLGNPHCLFVFKTITVLTCIILPRTPCKERSSVTVPTVKAMRF